MLKGVGEPTSRCFWGVEGAHRGAGTGGGKLCAQGLHPMGDGEPERECQE